MKKVMILGSLFFAIASINCQSEQDFLFEHPELDNKLKNAYKAYRNSEEYQSEQKAVSVWGPIYRNEAILVNGRNLRQLRDECIMAMERQGNDNSQECALFHEWQQRSKKLEKESREDLDRAQERLRKAPTYIALRQLNDHIASEAKKAQ